MICNHSNWRLNTQVPRKIYFWFVCYVYFLNRLINVVHISDQSSVGHTCNQKMVIADFDYSNFSSVLLSIFFKKKFFLPICLLWRWRHAIYSLVLIIYSQLYIIMWSKFGFENTILVKIVKSCFKNIILRFYNFN